MNQIGRCFYKNSLSITYNSIAPPLFTMDKKEREIKCILDFIPAKSNSVVVYDIDNTLLYSSGKPLENIVNTYKYARTKGFLTAIITARRAFEKNIERTLKQLEDIGIVDYLCLYLKEPDVEDVARYKTLARKDINDRGYNIVMSIGDLPSDTGIYGGIGYVI